MDKESDAFRTISEVAEELDVPKHVLRFWEVKFPHIRPMKRGGGRRYYRPEDLDLLRGIRHLLHAEGYTIKGVQKILREQGIEQVKRSWRERGATSRRQAATASAALAQPKTPPQRAIGTKAGPAMGRLSSAQRQLIEKALGELETCRTLLNAGRPGGGARRPSRAETND